LPQPPLLPCSPTPQQQKTATATHKHRPSDRYSSQTHDRKHVADQVSNLYENGNSYRKTIRKTKKVEESSLAAKNKATTTSGSSSTGSSGTSKATIPSNEHILNQLNRYPALILNADYQVCIIHV